MTSDARKEMIDYWTAHGAYEGILFGDAKPAADKFLSRNIVIPLVEIGDSEVRDVDGFVSAGGGPEEAVATVNANPQWLRNRAVNFLKIADHLEALEAEKASRVAARDRRRKEIALELGAIGDPERFTPSPLSNALDRILDLEQSILDLEEGR